jgi:uncharacterized sporulation protein YeaH/YhbH (DUF444 family)
MSNVIDRRAQGKNKSAVNRDRFLKRYTGKIKEAVERSISGRSITDVEKGADVSISGKDITEPYFGHGKGGIRDSVGTGNDEHEYVKGDTFRRPSDKRGRGSGDPSDDADPFNDEFIFTLTKEEFMHYFFEGLELPDMVKKQLKETEAFKYQRAGYKTSGATTNIHVLRSLQKSLGRRIALGSGTRREMETLQDALTDLLNSGVEDTDDRIQALLARIKELDSKLARIPFLDDIDIRYSNTIQVPKPFAKAVMFCVMDVSGSMDEDKKSVAKRFFILLYLFLSREYENIDVVFIRHTTEAQEVTEQEFFHSQESGGTVVSSALELVNDIIRERYLSDCNIYVAQASDGDNFMGDSVRCRDIILEKIMPAVQYFAYVEISEGFTQNLWDQYEKIAAVDSSFAIRQIRAVNEIYPVFCDLFKKRER